MRYLRALEESAYFEKGHLYPILDDMEDGGFLVVDKQNERHYLTGNYWPEHFLCEEEE